MELGYETFAARLDELKQLARNGAEFWTGRAIQTVLGYTAWRNFEEVIEKAQMACTSGGGVPEKHFVGFDKMVAIGSGAQRSRADWILSRYACYLVAMNAEASKPEVGFAQAYFAVQTRRQEIQDQLSADEKRLLLRDRVKQANKALNAAARRAGVQKYAIFHDAGYKGLYGGIDQADIKARKGIPAQDALLDRIDRAELAANEFRITQTEQKLDRDRVNTEPRAIQTHHDVGVEVRATIRRIGGTLPEDLPAAAPIRALRPGRRRKKLPAGE